MAIWVLKDGNREGPYEDGDLRELMYEGTYSDTDAAMRDGDPAQRTLGEILGHRPSQASQQPVPPPLPPESVPVSAVPAIAAPPALPPPVLPLSPPPVMPVSVVDFQMPFGSMVIFMIKWALASIPAMLIIATIFAIFWTIVIAATGGVFSALSR